ncbi:MAG: hypothetical protein ACRD0Z_05895 [Acidimicrobiales bacterium]
MISITGPGRSGTSVLAALYAELGFDAGGQWSQELDAGYEARDIVAVNKAIGSDLGITMTGKARGPTSFTLPQGSALSKISKRYQLHHRLNTLPGLRAGKLGLVAWDRFDATVEKHAATVRQLAGERQISKDPRYIYTLPVWLEAGADISHVVVTTRKLDAALASRRDKRLVGFSSDCDAKNSLIFGVGLCLTTCLDHGVAFSLIRFPEFLNDTGALAALPLLGDVPRADLDEAVRAVVRPELVHF